MSWSQSSSSQLHKPLSPHWADVAAFRLVKERGKKPGDTLTVASGITPSGTIHVGNFREVMTSDLLSRALRDLGMKVRFLYSWDNFDAFRKVPGNFPHDRDWSAYLGRRLSEVPDPWPEDRDKASSSLPQGRMQLFEHELSAMGIQPEYRYQEDLYSQGTYGQGIKRALQHKDQIREILNQHRTQPLLDEQWWPLVCYCPSCGKNTTDLSYDGDEKLTSKCRSCGSEHTHKITQSSHIKLSWRVDWPMRWAQEGVDIEPGGKDHSSRGGSYDTGCQIAREVFSINPPQYLPYDFVMIRGMAGKMSSSSGQVITITELLEIYEPAMIRWIFAGQRPNHDFAIPVGADVIKVYDEFDRDERMALSEPPSEGKLMKKYPMIKRMYEFSCVDSRDNVQEDGEKKPLLPPSPGFRALCDQLQMYDLNIEKTLKRFYREYLEHQTTRDMCTRRARAAVNWLRSRAPADFVYKLRVAPPESGEEFSQHEREILKGLRNLMSDLVEKTSAAHPIKIPRQEASKTSVLTPEQIHEQLYKDLIHGNNRDPGEVFSVIYRALIGRNRGPKLAGFLAELGGDKVLGLLDLALAHNTP